MITEKSTPGDIDEYIAGFPVNVQKLLKLLRETIKKNAPEALEVISYGMAAFKLHSMLVYFAAHNHHVGFYPGASAVAIFKDELKEFKIAKGSIQFPFDKPLPIDIITRIIQFRVVENLEKAAAKKRKK